MVLQQFLKTIFYFQNLSLICEEKITIEEEEISAVLNHKDKNLEYFFSGIKKLIYH